MVLLALKGFRFEMIDDIIIHRVYASTHIAEQKMKTLIEAFTQDF